MRRHPSVLSRLARLPLLGAALVVAGCASAPPPERPSALYADALFAAPSEPVSTAGVLEVDDAMRRYLAVDIAPQLHRQGAQDGLIAALYKHSQLKLDYDSGRTRTAAEAFAARSGNCLSLVLDDRRLRARARPARRLPERLPRRDMEPRRRPAVRQRPRQRHGRPQRHGRGDLAHAQSADGRLPPAAGHRRHAHARDRRADRAGDVLQQPCRRGPGPGPHRRRLCLGRGGDAARPGLRQCVQHAGCRLPAPRQPRSRRRRPRACARPRPAKHAGDVEPGPGLRTRRRRRAGSGAARPPGGARAVPAVPLLPARAGGDAA